MADENEETTPKEGHLYPDPRTGQNPAESQGQFQVGSFLILNGTWMKVLSVEPDADYGYRIHVKEEEPPPRTRPVTALFVKEES